MYDFSQAFSITGINPDQSAGSNHPVGRFQAAITGTEIKPTKDNDGGYLAIEFSTPSGKIVKRLNLWNNNPQAVDIAVKELAAIGYATGVHHFAPILQNQARELIQQRCSIEVKQQTKNPQYTEVAFVYDVNGVDPKDIAAGRGNQQQPQGGQQPFGQPQGQPQGQQSQPSGGNPFAQPQGGQTPQGNGGTAWPNAGAAGQPQGQQQPQGGNNPFGQPSGGSGNAGPQQSQPQGGGNPFANGGSGGTPAGAPWANRG